jgi:uncharacterized repeat protein (TIGR03803 family)
MPGKIVSIRLKITLAILTPAIFISTLFVAEASAGTLKVLHNFNGADGVQPAGVVLDASGNLYGVAQGGSRGFGLAFELTPTASGHWNEKALIQFNRTTGMYPNPIVFDFVGNLYGTLGRTARLGTGAVFELSPTTDGDWQETTLESFTLKDGAFPSSGVIFDDAGNLYGTTQTGGASGAGTVFELSPNLDGTWTEVVLYSFTGKTDGQFPGGGVIFDAAGNLYGTTFLGGASGFGTVFELSPNPGGTWTETVLYSFRGGLDAANPDASTLTFDKAGNLYGETAVGGNDRCGGCGVVFELSPIGGGSWTETVLYRFDGTDGEFPWVGLVFDAAGNIYGTTQSGGAYGNGVVFELKP